MEELVGFCAQCGKPIHCLHGFLNGVVSRETETLYCFPCHDKQKEKENSETSECHGR